MDSERKGLRVNFEVFQKKYLPYWRVEKIIAPVEELIEPLKPGAMDGVPPFVMKCSCF